MLFFPILGIFLIPQAITDFKTSKVVVRTGKATRVNDLAQLNPASARSIIVLRGNGESDAHVVKVVLALAQLLPSDSTTPIVVQVEDVLDVMASSSDNDGRLSRPAFTHAFASLLTGDVCTYRKEEQKDNSG